jgi:hypothetical protein
MWPLSLRISAVWILSVALVAPLLLAQDEEEEGDDAWKAERTKLQQVIDARVEAEVTKNVTKNDIIKQLKWRAPVKPPAKTKEQIIAAEDEKIDAAANKRFPEEERLKFAKEAAGSCATISTTKPPHTSTRKCPNGTLNDTCASKTFATTPR